MKLLGTMFSLIRHDTQTGIYSLSPVVEHFIYKAHFPGYPITPGVCILKIIGELLCIHLEKKVVLLEVKNIKFVSPVIPNPDSVVDVFFQKIDINDTVSVQGVISGKGKIYSKFSLVYMQEEEN